LVLGNLEVRHDAEQVSGLGSKAWKHVLGITIVFVYAAEPLPDHQVLYSRNALDLVAVRDGDWLRQRYAVARDEAKRLGWCRIAQEHGLVHRHQHTQDAQGNRHAADRQDAAPPITQTILQNER
jgi:hypothetical protein